MNTSTRFNLTALCLAALLLSGTGCSHIAVSLVGNALSGGDGELFASEDDPELVRDALPFGLKSIEALVAASPEDEDLLLVAASSFTQFAYAFVQQEAQLAESVDPARARRELARAKKLFRRARDYGMRAIEAEFDEDFRKKLDADPVSAFEELDDEDAVPYLYWTAGPWALLITLSMDDLSMLGELAKVEAMMRHALWLDPDWNKGTLHEFFISFEARGEFIGGSLAKAKEHYDRVIALTEGRKIGPHVTWAESVAVSQQDRATFDRLIALALAFDTDSAPEYRLVNIISQRRAQWLKDNAPDLFVEE
ncbi:MAG: TRAP transporter TatT component family protein [Myxococcales bacterium]|jgi:hypothetical protein|nr:TRAP transporter TatT component family protein [Myxococcales bacterium]